MQLLDSTIIATSLPMIAADFGIDAVALGSAFTIYMLTMAALLPAAGALSQRLGARNLLIAAVAGFAMASWACAMAESLPQFLIARGLQGAAAAMMAPVGRIFVLQHARQQDIVQAVATITWPALFAPVLGPIVGGWISTHLGWQWNFFINLPLCLLAGGLLFWLSPNQPADRPGRFDLRGFALSSGGIVALLSGFELFIAGSEPVRAAVLSFAGGALLIAAMRHLRRADQPLVDLRVLRVDGFRLATLGPGTISRIAINATPFLLPLLFQLGFGLGAIRTGSLLLVYFLGNLAMKTVTTPMLRRFGYRSLLVWNGFLAGLLVAIFAVLPEQTPQPLLWLVLFVGGLTRSMQFTALATLSVAEIEGNERPSAMTLAAMTQQIAMVLAVACSVAVIRLSQWWGQRASEAELSDYRTAFLVLGLAGACAALAFLRLEVDSGRNALTRPPASARPQS